MFENVCVLLLVKVNCLPASSCRTSEPVESPLTVALMLYEDVVVHVTCTLVTFAVAVPLPFATVQFCAGFDGCVATVTAYALPLAIAFGKAKFPFALTASVAPLLASIRPVPDNPETVPPIV